MQIDFLLELFKKAKAKGIGTCIDTSGASFTNQGEYFEKFKELMESWKAAGYAGKKVDDALWEEFNKARLEDIDIYQTYF